MAGSLRLKNTYDGDPPLMLLMLASFTQANSRLSRAWLTFEHSAPTVATELCSSRATEQQFLSLSQHALGSRYSSPPWPVRVFMCVLSLAGQDMHLSP